MAMEDDAEEGDNRAVEASIRSAKKASRPNKIGIPDRRPGAKSSKSKAKKAAKIARSSTGKFDQDLGQRAHEGARSKKGANPAVFGKKGGGKKSK